MHGDAISCMLTKFQPSSQRKMCMQMKRVPFAISSALDRMQLGCGTKGLTVSRLCMLISAFFEERNRAATQAWLEPRDPRDV